MAGRQMHSGTDDSADGRIAVILVSGFLGSGKSTLLNRWLGRPEAGRAAVIVNEFGAIGIDQALLRASHDDLVLLDSGCVCCTLRGDLATCLRDLYRQRSEERIPRFDWVAVETTGLAAPGPILHTFALDPVLAARYSLSALVTTVDAVNGGATLDRYREAVDQVVHADRLVLTKSDLARPADVDRMRARLATLNPGAPVSTGRSDAVHELLARGARDTAAGLSRIVARLSAVRNAAPKAPRRDADLAACSAAHRHDAGIESFCVTRDAPLRWDDVAPWLDGLASTSGDRLLRVKGLLNVEGADGPLLVQGAQHLMHPPVWLGSWPDADRRSRLVFITRGLGQPEIEAALHRTAPAVAGMV